MTAFGSIETAVRAVKEAAFDYISKPFNLDELIAIVRRALTSGTGKQLASGLDDDERSSGLIGRTASMLESELFGHVKGEIEFGLMSSRPD